jgi:hypothetical protein
MIASPAPPAAPPRPALGGRAGIAALLLLGLALRLPGLPLTGSPDTYIWKVWAYTAATRGLTAAYPLQGRDGWPPLSLDTLAAVRAGRILPGATSYARHGGPTDYPPGAVAVLWLVGKVYQAVFAPDFTNSPTFSVLLKLPLVLADALTAALIGWAVRRRAGPARPALPWLAACAYWLNPAVIVAGAVLGYLDALYALPLTAALLLAALGRFGASGAAWALAFMMKLQGLFVAPALAVLGVRGGARGLARGALGAALVIAATCAPFALRGSLIGVVAGVGGNIPGLGPGSAEDYLSANQVNLWWLWSYFWEAGAERAGPGVLTRIVPVSMIREMGVADLNLWTQGLFLAFLLGTTGLWLWRRGRRGGPLAVADLFLLPLHFWGATMLLASIHENHLLGALPLLALLAALAAGGGARRDAWRLGVLYAALSAIAGLNLTLFYGFGRGAIAPTPRMWFGFDGSVVLAAANVLLFALALAIWGRAIASPRAHAPPAAIAEGAAPARD